MLNKSSLISLFLILFVGLLRAQQSEQYNIFQLRFLYNDIKFTEVIDQGRELLKPPHELSRESLLEIHRYMALAFYNKGQQDSSRSHFYSILTLNPDFEPDPVQTSPKILLFFNEIKTSFRQDKELEIAVPFNQYIFIEDIRSQAAIRSLVLPGWGQLYKNQETKAYLFGSTFLATALTTIITYQIEKDLQKKYRNEIRQEKIKQRYDDYNNMSKTRRFFMYTTFSAWGLSLADALISDYAPPITLNKGYNGISLSIVF